MLGTGQIQRGVTNAVQQRNSAAPFTMRRLNVVSLAVAIFPQHTGANYCQPSPPPGFGLNPAFRTSVIKGAIPQGACGTFAPHAVVNR